jgi:hypothetical protein
VVPYVVTCAVSQLVAVCGDPPVFVQVTLVPEVTLRVVAPVEVLNPQLAGEAVWRQAPLVSQIVIGVPGVEVPPLKR